MLGFSPIASKPIAADKNAASGTTISAAITESSDVVAANIGLTVSLSAAITESSDAVASTVSNIWSISAAITESSDVVASSVNVGDVASLSAAITESPDVVAATANLVVGLSAAINESSDVVAATLNAVSSLSAAITESPDAVASTVSVSGGTASLSADITEPSDVVSSSVSLIGGEVAGGGFAWKGPAEPNYRVHPEYADKPAHKTNKKVQTPEVIELAPDLHVQTGIAPVRPAWDVMAELQQRQSEADQARQDKLRQIALADDEWLMVA